MQTFFKVAGPSARVQRALRTRTRDNAERVGKDVVRRRDKTCRFPLCGCRRLGLTLEVSHNLHKGFGGNPEGDRSTPELMMLLCRERHQTNPFSIHKHNLYWQPLNRKLGANGPVSWWVDVAHYHYRTKSRGLSTTSHFYEVARETSAGVPVVVELYRELLVDLATMVL